MMSCSTGRRRLVRKRRTCSGGSRSWRSGLARVKERLSRLVIARETVDEVLSEAGADVPLAAEPEVTGPPVPGHSPVIGVLAVPVDILTLRAVISNGDFERLGRPVNVADMSATQNRSSSAPQSARQSENWPRPGS